MAVCDDSGDLCKALNNHLRTHGERDERMSGDIRHLGESLARVEGGLASMSTKLESLAPAAKRGRDAWDLILRALVALAALVAAYVLATSMGQAPAPSVPAPGPIIVVPQPSGAPAPVVSGGAP